MEVKSEIRGTKSEGNPKEIRNPMTEGLRTSGRWQGPMKVQESFGNGCERRRKAKSRRGLPNRRLIVRGPAVFRQVVSSSRRSVVGGPERDLRGALLGEVLTQCVITGDKIAREVAAGIGAKGILTVWSSRWHRKQGSEGSGSRWRNPSLTPQREPRDARPRSNLNQRCLADNRSLRNPNGGNQPLLGASLAQKNLSQVTVFV